jgi:hypothetical protein
MKQVPSCGPTDIRPQHTVFSCHGDLASGTCVPLSLLVVVLQIGTVNYVIFTRSQTVPSHI